MNSCHSDVVDYHDSAASHESTECIGCHGDRTDEQSLFDAAQGQYYDGPHKVHLTSDQMSFECTQCHESVDTREGAASSVRRQVSMLCSECHSPFTKEVELTYGGGVYKQRYMTTVGDSIHMLPLQYNARGDESSPERTRKQWRDYHLDWWINDPAGTPAFKAQPSNNNAVDIQCASCHGPGSEHVAVGGQGEHIVSPQNTTPERESTICSQCHSRPQGNDSFGLHKDSPLDSSNKMMVAGTSRADFLANNTSRHDASSSDLWPDGLHSKSHHQQYTDFIQSALYRNGSELVTCASCHDNHGPGTDRHQLSGTSDDSLCLTCHSGINSSDHQISKSGYDMGASCIECHNVKTSSSGAGTNPTGTYPHGDISSHRFDVPDKAQAVAAKMPVPYTNTCGSCHWPLSNAPAGEQPDLKLEKQGVYWDSYADYSSRTLSVDFNIVNGSADIAGNAYGVQMVGTSSTGGVTSVNTPLAIGSVPAGYDAAKTSVVKYHVPMGVTAFITTVYATAEDGDHTGYAYPGPMPTP